MTGISPKTSQRKGWIYGIARSINRSLVKRQARILLNQLITLNKKEDELGVAALQRYRAAAALVRIAEKTSDGEEIVARRFVKTTSRKAQGTEALLKLSDDELDKFGCEAIIPVSTPVAYRKLLAVVLKHSNESSFFGKIIKPLLRDGTDGPAAILYLATEETQTFFTQVERHIILKFCGEIVVVQEPLSPRWYCGAKLLLMLLRYSRRVAGENQLSLQLPLFTILRGFIRGATENSQSGAPKVSENHFTFHGLPGLPLIAECCRRIEESYLPTSSSSGLLKPFVELLINFVCPLHPGSRELNTERGLAVSALISLLKLPSVVKLLSDVEISRAATFIMDIALHSWVFKFQEADAFEKAILKQLTAKDDLFFTCFCSLPSSRFSGALSTTLKEGIVRLDSPNVNPYEPLGLVERLLWLSTVKVDEEQIHRALVDGGAFEFLAHSLNYTGDLNPEDRGLWRAKGLAMTCIGNIVERLNKEQLCNCIKEEMISSVVAIKEDATVPLVQRGQAIFLLQRYTLAADCFGVQPFHRENTSNMDEEFQKANRHDLVLFL